MARMPRLDFPDSAHHVMHRGINRKPIFETRRDIRRFLALVARAVRRGEIQVHAFAVLTTHVHMLVRSPRAELALAMKRILGEYTRYYNWTRDRDGTVWRGRFTSKPIRSYAYWCAVLRYIDQNPVQAGLAAKPWDYPYASARSYVTRRGPPWLARTPVEALVCALAGAPSYSPDLYQRTFGGQIGCNLEALIERRTDRSVGSDAPLDDLVAAAPPAVRAWMDRQAMQADSSRAGSPLVPAALIESLLRKPGQADLVVCPRSKRLSGLEIAAVALLRDLGGLTCAEVGRRLHCAHPTVTRRHADHALLVRTDETYAELVTTLAMSALREVSTELSAGSEKLLIRCQTPD